MIELTRAEIDELLHEQVVGRVGCHADGETYVVPLVYAYDGEAIYVATIEGRKLDMMRANPSVCFEVDAFGPDGWSSAIVQGRFEELADTQVPGALELLRERFAGTGAGARRREAVSGGVPDAVWFRIAVTDVTGRAVRHGGAAGGTADQD